MREALFEGLLFPYQKLNKRPEFAEAPAIGGGALTTERRANGQALGRADNIKRDRANVYLTHTQVSILLALLYYLVYNEIST